MGHTKKRCAVCQSIIDMSNPEENSAVLRTAEFLKRQDAIPYLQIAPKYFLEKEKEYSFRTTRRSIMENYYDVEDSCDNWFTIAGLKRSLHQVASIKDFENNEICFIRKDGIRKDKYYILVNYPVFEGQEPFERRAIPETRPERKHLNDVGDLIFNDDGSPSFSSNDGSIGEIDLYPIAYIKYKSILYGMSHRAIVYYVDKYEGTVPVRKRDMTPIFNFEAPSLKTKSFLMQKYGTGQGAVIASAKSSSKYSVLMSEGVDPILIMAILY